MKIKSFFAIVISIAMLLTFVGCKSASEDNSSELEYVVEEEYVYVDGEKSPDNSTVVSVQQGNQQTQNPNSDTNTNTNTNTSSSTVDIQNTVPEKDFSGTTVKFAVTSDPRDSEKAPVIDSFEQKYGITIEPVIITGDFITELKGLIAAGDSPDVVRSSGDFPLSLSYLQSLDAAKLDYDDPIWEQGMFEMTTFNGSPYLCTTEGNVYTETDIVVYRKDILEAAGCKTPEEYDKEGNWNIDAFFEIARQCVKKVNGVNGCSFVNYDSAIHMTGNSVFKLKDGKFVNGIGNSAIDVFEKLSTVKNEGIISLNATGGIVDGTVAITTHHSYALRKTGAFESNKDIWTKLGYYYLPSFGANNKNLKTGLLRGWGLIRGAQNPEAAGVFLRYYLDPNNFNIDDMYISSEATRFFLEATDIDYNNWNPYFTYGENNETIAGIDFYDDIYSNISLNKTQIVTKMPNINSRIDTACKNLNDYVAQKTYEN